MGKSKYCMDCGAVISRHKHTKRCRNCAAFVRRGHFPSQETRHRMSEARKRAWQEGLYRDRETKELNQRKSELRKLDWERGIYGSESYCERLSQIRKEAWDKGIIYGPRGQAVLAHCGFCGREILVKEKRRKRFCSPACMGKAISKAQCGSANPNWHNGVSFEPYPPSFNEIFKQKIRERDGYACAICRLFGKSVHHINYKKDDTTPGNCITLCHLCHSRTGGKRKYWQDALSKLLIAREALCTL